MSGSKKGVASQILAEEKRAIFTHCYAHALNLAVADTIKKSKICNTALEVAFEITRLVKFSPKRNTAFDRIKEGSDEDSTGIGIKKFCYTRWTVRGDSIGSILENYNILNQECLESKLEPDVKGRILGAMTRMSEFKVLFGLQLCKRILKITDNLSKKLQKQSLSAAQGQELAQLTVKTVSNEDR